MLAILFLTLGGFTIWTGITLLKQGPNNDEIKLLLTKMGINAISLFESFILIINNFKQLFKLLNNSEKHNEIETINKDKVHKSNPKLIKLGNSKERNVA